MIIAQHHITYLTLPQRHPLNAHTPKQAHFLHRQTSNIRRIKSQNWNVSPVVLQLSLPNPLRPGVESRMKINMEQRLQAMLQLHLSDQQFYCLLRCGLYYWLDGRSYYPATNSGTSKRVSYQSVKSQSIRRWGSPRFKLRVHDPYFQISCSHFTTLQWRHNGRDGVSNNRRLDGLLNRLFRHRSKK